MSSPFTTPGPIDLDGLNEYLTSDRSPPDCMDLAQLDGFLAGVLVGPEPIMPSEFLPVIWGGEQPEFDDAAEADSILNSILGRYNEIAEGLAAEPQDYSPVFYQDIAGNVITEEWSVGFMQAVALRNAAWEPALHDEAVGTLLISIGIIAGWAEPDIALNDAELPEGFLDELMEQAGDLLPVAVVQIREFWIERADVPGVGLLPPRKRRH